MMIDKEKLALVCGGAYDPAKSDGCTMAPDGWWKSACVTHDGRYYGGGSAADRKNADRELRDNMIAAGAPPAVARAYQLGVRLGGFAHSGLPWQWGFGKNDR